MKKNYFSIFIFLLIFLSILLVAYPVTYFLIKTPYYNCSNLFNSFINSMTSLDPEYKNCIKITHEDVKNIFHIFTYWFVSFFIFFYFFYKIFMKIKLSNLVNWFHKYSIGSNFLYYVVIIGSPLIYAFSIFFNIDKFNFIFLLNKCAFIFLMFLFFHKNKKIFFIYSVIIVVPVFFGEISQILPIILILMYINFYKKLTFSKIIKSLIGFFIIFTSLIFTQDYFKKNYGYTDLAKYNISFNNYQFKIKKYKRTNIEENYFKDQIKFTQRNNYFKLDNHLSNEYLKLIYNRTLRRLSEINHTVIVKKILDKENAKLLYGKTYERLPVLLVPRIIYPEKPSETYGNILICEFGIGGVYKNKEECYKNNTTSVNLNVILEGYINYNVYGLIFSSFFIALFGAISLTLINTSSYFLNIFGFTILHQAMMYQSNLTGIIGGIILCIVSIVPLMLLKKINEI